MADKWDEITQLEVAYDALKSQPREAQTRMLIWLIDRLSDDYTKAVAARTEATLKRVQSSAKESQS